MVTVNGERQIFQGFWKIEQRNEKPLIDYVMNNKNHLQTIKEIILDDTTDHATFKIEH